MRHPLLLDRKPTGLFVTLGFVYAHETLALRALNLLPLPVLCQYLVLLRLPFGQLTHFLLHPEQVRFQVVGPHRLATVRTRHLIMATTLVFFQLLLLGGVPCWILNFRHIFNYNIIYLIEIIIYISR